jgi:hypothetical protein
LLLTNWDGVDSASYITDYWIQWGSTPGDDDVATVKYAGNLTQAFASVADRSLAGPLVAGEKIFATVWARDFMGYYSERVSSNGVSPGGGEATIDPEAEEPAVIGFDMAPAGTSGDDGDGTPAKTMGGVSIPPGALGGGSPTTFLGGNVDDGTAANGTVNATAEAPPAENFKFGGYSFTLKAAGPDGKVQEHYEFEEPITMFLYYNVWEVLKPGQEPEDVQPEMYLWDTKTENWIQAADSCPPEKYRSEVDYVNNQYILNICHLTQFAMFVQDAPKAILEASILIDDYVATGKTAPEVRRLEAVQSMSVGATFADYLPMAQQTDRPFVYLLQHGTDCNAILLDGSNSYDTDGIVEHWVWELRSPYGDPVGTLLNDSDVSHSITASIDGRSVMVEVNDPGLFLVALTVVDDQAAERTAAVAIVLNEPPIIEPIEDIVVGFDSISALDTLIVMLEASARDPEGAPVDVMWRWTSSTTLSVAGLPEAELLSASSVPNLVPTGAQAALSNFASARTRHVVQVVAVDNDGGESTRYTSVSVVPHASLTLEVQDVVNATYNARGKKLALLDGFDTASATISASESEYPLDIVSLDWSVSNLHSGQPMHYVCTGNVGAICDAISMSGLSRGTVALVLTATDVLGLRTSIRMELGVNRAPLPSHAVPVPHYVVVDSQHPSAAIYIRPDAHDPDGDQLLHTWAVTNATSTHDGPVPELSLKQSTFGDELKVWGFVAPAQYHLQVHSDDGWGGDCLSSMHIYSLMPRALNLSAPSVWRLDNGTCDQCSASVTVAPALPPLSNIIWSLILNDTGEVVHGECGNSACTTATWSDWSIAAAGSYVLKVELVEPSGYSWDATQVVRLSHAPVVELQSNLIVQTWDEYLSSGQRFVFPYTAQDNDGDLIHVTATAAASSIVTCAVMDGTIECQGLMVGSNVSLVVVGRDTQGLETTVHVTIRIVQTPTISWAGVRVFEETLYVDAADGETSASFTLEAASIETSYPLHSIRLLLEPLDGTESSLITPLCQASNCTIADFVDVPLGAYGLLVDVSTHGGLASQQVAYLMVNAVPHIESAQIRLEVDGTVQQSADDSITVSSMAANGILVLSVTAKDVGTQLAWTWEVVHTSDSRGADFVTQYLLLGSRASAAALSGLEAASYEIQVTVTDDAGAVVSQTLTATILSVQQGVSFHAWYAMDQPVLVEGRATWNGTAAQHQFSSTPLVVVLHGTLAANAVVSFDLSLEAQRAGLSTGDAQVEIAAGTTNGHAITTLSLADDASAGLVDLIEDAVLVTVVSAHFAFMTPEALPISLEVVENDIPGLSVNATHHSVTEGSTGFIMMQLSTKPAANVTVRLTTDADDETNVPDSVVTLSPAVWTFTTEDWDSVVSVNVNSNHDQTRTGNALVAVGATISSTDAAYDGMEVTQLPSLFFTDADSADVVISSPTAATANSTLILGVKLSSRPSAAVLVALSVSADGEAAAERLALLDDALVPFVDQSSAQVIFEPSNWESEQTVTVHVPWVPHDMNGPVIMSIESLLSSSDDNFEAKSGSTPLTVHYNEIAEWHLSCDGDLVFYDGQGTSVMCYISLTHMPLAPLLFTFGVEMREAFHTLDTPILHLSRESAAIAAHNWAEVHQIEISVPQYTDGFLSGDSNGSFVAKLQTFDPAYGRTDTAALDLRFVDQDSPGVITNVSSLGTEGIVDEGSTVELQVSLTARPSLPVIAHFSVLDPSGRVQAQLNVDALSWLPLQSHDILPVQLTLVRDWIEPVMAYMQRERFTLLTELESSDPRFHGYQSSIALVESNVDRVGISTIPSTVSNATVVEGAPGIVVLAGLQTIPSADVMLTLELHAPTLNFTAEQSHMVHVDSWRARRPLSVAFPRDGVNFGDGLMHVALRVTSTDPRYRLGRQELGTVNVVDVDTPGLEFVPPALVVQEGGNAARGAIHLASKPKLGRVRVILQLEGDDDVVAQSSIEPSEVVLGSQATMATFSVFTARDGRFSGRVPVRVVAHSMPLADEDQGSDEQFRGLSTSAVITYIEADHSPGLSFDLHPRRWANTSSGTHLGWLRLRKAHGVPSEVLDSPPVPARPYPILTPLEAYRSGMADPFGIQLFSKPWADTHLSIELKPDFLAGPQATKHARIEVIDAAGTPRVVSSTSRNNVTGDMRAVVHIVPNASVGTWQHEDGAFSWMHQHAMRVLIWHESPTWEPVQNARSVVLRVVSQSLDTAYDTEVVAPTKFSFAAGSPPAVVGVGGLDFCAKVHDAEIVRSDQSPRYMSLGLSTMPRSPVRVTFDVSLDVGLASSGQHDIQEGIASLMRGVFAPIDITPSSWATPVKRELTAAGIPESLPAARIRVMASVHSDDRHYDGVTTTTCHLRLGPEPRTEPRVLETLLVVVGVLTVALAIALVWRYTRLKAQSTQRPIKSTHGEAQTSGQAPDSDGKHATGSNGGRRSATMSPDLSSIVEEETHAVEEREKAMAAANPMLSSILQDANSDLNAEGSLDERHIALALDPHAPRMLTPEEIEGRNEESGSDSGHTAGSEAHFRVADQAEDAEVASITATPEVL